MMHGFEPPVEWEPLHEADFEKLAGISRQRAIESCIFRVSSDAGGLLIGRSGTQNMAGIAFSNILPGERKPRAFRLRRDIPDYRWSGGKLKEEGKYLSEPRARNLLYFAPGTDPTMLADSSLDIVLTEGEKKVLSLSETAVHNVEKPRWLAVGISGVWCFRDRGDKATNSKGERVSVNAPIPDLSRVVWKSRRVHITFDSNVATNPSVAAARNQLAIELIGRGAEVWFVDVPDEVNGIDDYTANHGPDKTVELIASARLFDPKERLAKLHYTDAGNEEAFELLCGDNYLYNATSQQWLYFNGVYWQPDELNRIDRDMLAVAQARLDATATGQDDAAEFKRTGDPRKDRRKAVAGAMRLQNVRARQAALESATSNPRFAHPAEHFDQNDLLFACANGVIDLETGEFREGRRDDMITLASPVAWNSAASSDTWVTFLHSLFPSNPEMVAFLQVALGYCLTGLTKEELFFILHGTGRNGKGTFMRPPIAILGNYAATTEFSTLIQGRDDSKAPRNDIAALAGKRFVSAQESRQGAKLDESLIKSLTGGDMITARYLHREFFTFRPTWKIWLATNHRPEIKGSDTGIWSRPRLIPFNESFEGREDKGLKERLLAPDQLSGILRWMVEGCAIYLREGLKFPDEVTAATKGYKQENDSIGRFLEECCKRVDGLSAASREIYLAFSSWAKDNELETMTETAFGLAMVERGQKKKRGASGMRYVGLILDTERMARNSAQDSELDEEADCIRKQDVM